MTAATPRRTLRGMILTGLGLQFTRDGDRWRCVVWPGLVMFPGDGDEADGQAFDSLAEALAFLTGAAPGGPRN